MKTITLIALTSDDDTGAIDDASETVVSGIDDKGVALWKDEFKKFGDEQAHLATRAGLPPANIKQHRHSGHHGKP